MNKAEHWKYISLTGFSPDTFAADTHATLSHEIPEVLEAKLSSHPLAQLCLKRTSRSQKIILDKSELFTVTLVGQAQEAIHAYTEILVTRYTQAELVFECSSADDVSALLNLVTYIRLEEQAQLTVYYRQTTNAHTYLFHALWVEQARASQYRYYSLDSGGKLAKTDMQCNLNAPEAECHLHGLYVTKGKQVIAHHNTINHYHGHCRSSEHFRGIAHDQSKAVFNGKIMIAKDAQQSETQQINKNLLLSNQAEIDTKPELEIYNNNVKATHGATIGALDEQALFYLYSRGIDEVTAKALLLESFAKEPFVSMSNIAMRETFYEYA